MAGNEGSGENMKVDAAKGKLRWSLLSWSFIREMVEVMEHGTEKHAPNDWQKGADYSLYFDALQRHINAWWSGETIDPDSGKHHLTHAACCCMILVWYSKKGVGKDDRH